MIANWTSNDITVNGASIHYTRTGQGSGKPPLVLAHGFSDSGMCWLPAALELEVAYDVILPDARGHGLSARVQPGETIDMAADIAGLVCGLGLARPILGGHSMGANTSSQAAARFPGLASALILEDPGWRKLAPDLRPDSTQPKPPDVDPFHQWLMTVKDLSIEEVINKCRHDSPTWAEIELQPWAESKKEFDTNFLNMTHGLMMPWVEVVKKVTCPSLLITADISRGASVPPEVSAQVVQLNSHFQIINIPDAGHNIRRENFTAYIQAFTKFLKNCTQ
jgi:N-formylmaleamate deformylase